MNSSDSGRYGRNDHLGVCCARIAKRWQHLAVGVSPRNRANLSNLAAKRRQRTGAAPITAAASRLNVVVRPKLRAYARS
jgi:hypothetical protein